MPYSLQDGTVPPENPFKKWGIRGIVILIVVGIVGGIVMMIRQF